jgi:hypothetical protein
VWVQEPAETDDGMGADVHGSLAYDAGQDCFLLELEGVRYPVIWPAGTVGTADGPGVALGDGTVARLGDRVSAGGGYLPITEVADRYEIPAGCVPETGEVAVFNPNESLQVDGGQ